MTTQKSALIRKLSRTFPYLKESIIKKAAGELLPFMLKIQPVAPKKARAEQPLSNGGGGATLYTAPSSVRRVTNKSRVYLIHPVTSCGTIIIEMRGSGRRPTQIDTITRMFGADLQRCGLARASRIHVVSQSSDMVEILVGH